MSCFVLVTRITIHYFHWKQVYVKSSFKQQRLRSVSFRVYYIIHLQSSENSTYYGLIATNEPFYLEFPLTRSNFTPLSVHFTGFPCIQCNKLNIPCCEHTYLSQSSSSESSPSCVYRSVWEEEGVRQVKVAGLWWGLWG